MHGTEKEQGDYSALFFYILLLNFTQEYGLTSSIENGE